MSDEILEKITLAQRAKYFKLFAEVYRHLNFTGVRVTRIWVDKKTGEFIDPPAFTFSASLTELEEVYENLGTVLKSLRKHLANGMPTRYCNHSYLRAYTLYSAFFSCRI